MFTEVLAGDLGVGWLDLLPASPDFNSGYEYGEFAGIWRIRVLQDQILSLDR